MLPAKTVRRVALPTALLLLTCAMFAAQACRKGADASFIGTFRMGERVQVGPVTYQVLESDWRNELGMGGRSPRDRYLFLRMSVTNSSGKPVSLPSFTLEGNGKVYAEITEGMDKVDNWFGMLRTVQPSQTEQGWVVFDAPLAAYKLLVTDGGDIGSEMSAHVDIPVQLE